MQFFLYYTLVAAIEAVAAFVEAIAPTALIFLFNKDQ